MVVVGLVADVVVVFTVGVVDVMVAKDVVDVVLDVVVEAAFVGVSAAVVVSSGSDRRPKYTPTATPSETQTTPTAIAIFVHLDKGQKRRLNQVGSGSPFLY